MYSFIGKAIANTLRHSKPIESHTKRVATDKEFKHIMTCKTQAKHCDECQKILEKLDQN